MSWPRVWRSHWPCVHPSQSCRTGAMLTRQGGRPTGECSKQRLAPRGRSLHNIRRVVFGFLHRNQSFGHDRRASFSTAGMHLLLTLQWWEPAFSYRKHPRKWATQAKQGFWKYWMSGKKRRRKSQRGEPRDGPAHSLEGCPRCAQVDCPGSITRRGPGGAWRTP